MDNVLETPSRVLRRIRDHEARNDDLPSLPSLSFVDDLGNSVSQSFHQKSNKNAKRGARLSAKGFSDSEDASQESLLDADLRTPTARPWSTPVQPVAGAGPGVQQKRVTPGSSGSRVRFARSTHTRSFDQGGGARLGDSHISYVDVEESVRGGSESSRFTEDGGVESTPLPAAAIQRRQKTPRFQRVASLSTASVDQDDEEDVSHERSHRSAESIPDIYLPPSEDEQEGLGGFDEGISQSQTRSIQSEPEQKSYVDYDTSLKTSIRAQSPFDPIRHSINVSRRRQGSRQTQYAPSVSDSPSDPETSVSTPDVASIPLPRPTPFKSRVVDVTAQSEHATPSQATPRPAPRCDSPSISLSTPTSLAEPLRGASRSPPNRTSPAASSSPPNSNDTRHSIASTSPQPQPTPAQLPKNHFSTPAAKRAYQMVMSSVRPGASMKKGTASYPFRRPRFSLQHVGPAASESSQVVGEGTPGANDSFLSTASSHDLTIRTRANASFDMISDSMGRLDKIKLQVQLSRMNKLLTSENTELFEKNRNFSEENEHLRLQVDELQDLVYALKHGMELHEAKLDKLELEENDDAERLHEELEVSEKKLAETKRDRRQLEIQLSQAQAEADKERQGGLKLQDEVARISREHKDAERIVEDMRLKQIAQEAQLKHLKSIVKNRDEEIEALQVAGAAGSTAADLSSSLRRAKALSDRHAEDLERELEEVKDALDAQRRANARLEDDANRLQAGSISDKAHAQAVQKDLSTLQARFTSTVDELKVTEETLGRTTGELTRKQESLNDALEQISNLEAELGAVNDLEQQLAFTTDALRASELVALDEKKRAEHLEDERATLRVKVTSLERQLEDAESRLLDATRQVRGDPSVHHDDHISLARHDDAVATLEAQLDDAYRENGRLKQRIIENDTPGKRMTQDLLESKCKLLEEQKAEMAEQIAALRRILTEHVSVWEASLSMAAAAETTTPRRVSLGNRTATPGQKSILKGTPDLKDATWAQSEVDEKSIRAILAPLQSESAKLIQELRAANDRLHEKFEELDHIGSKNVSLKQQRDDALERERILRTDLDALRQRHRRLLQRLQAVRCLMCGENQNVSGMLKLEVKATAEGGDESADLRNLMADVEFQAERIKGQAAKLESEKRELEATAKQHGIQLKQAQKRAATNVTADPKRDEVLQRANGDEQRLAKKLQQERDTALAGAKIAEDELLRMGNYMKQLEAENGQLKSANHGLQGRPRSSSKNAGIRLEELGRGEPNNRDLQRYGTPAAVPEVERLRHELAQSQKAVGVLRKDHAELVSKLNALNDRAPHRMQASATHKSLMPGVDERIRDISGDIRSLGHDADALASELAALRSERDRLRNFCEEAQSTLETNEAQHRHEIRDLKHRLEELEGEENVFGVLDNLSLRGVQRLHKEQCKGLFLQIRYLQVCLARESDRRSDLSYQKHYLLNIVACFENSESHVLALISRIGYPVRGPQVRRSKLRRTVFAVMFTIRVRRACERWRSDTSMRPNVLAALEDVRRRRALQVAVG